ncbi:MAG: hypothetical protein ACRDNI_11835 [Gaiellaceae bacterium]
MAEEVASVFAFDSDAEAVATAQAQLAAEHEERVTFRVGSARQIEIPRNTVRHRRFLLVALMSGARGRRARPAPLPRCADARRAHPRSAGDPPQPSRRGRRRGRLRDRGQRALRDR